MDYCQKCCGNLLFDGDDHPLFVFDKLEYINRLMKELAADEGRSTPPLSPPNLALDEIFDEDFMLEMEEAIYTQIDEYEKPDAFNVNEKCKEKMACQISENIIESISLIFVNEPYETDNELFDNNFATIPETSEETTETMAEFIQEHLNEEDIYNFVKERMDIFFKDIYPNIHEIPQIPRSIKMADFNNTASSTAFPLKKAELSRQIEWLKQQPQPEQRTPEWYKYRNNLMTASNIYKIFGTQSQYNSFICEKCQPDVREGSGGSGGRINPNDARQWGQKYEKLSIQLYEDIYQTTVDEFGCITHPDYSYIGASPDGIVTGNNHYGRMVEVKNIVNRIITGTPIEAYWVQMQIQMEVCNLDICDFIETRIKECETVDKWKLIENKRKGVVIFNDETAEYNFVEFKETEELIDAFIERWKTADEMNEPVEWWYVDEFSCVVVPRNKAWFASVLPKLTETWEIIVTERQTGNFKERLPKKKTPKCLVSLPIDDYVTTIKNSANDANDINAWLLNCGGNIVVQKIGEPR